jgi:hypothetical protein
MKQLLTLTKKESTKIYLEAIAFFGVITIICLLFNR